MITVRTMKKTREELACYAHEAWSGWMRYMFERSARNPDGTITIPAWAVERWERQASTPYDELPEDEKRPDLHEADQMLRIFSKEALDGRLAMDTVSCEKCGHKTILATGIVTEFKPDQEPYEPGRVEDCGYDGRYDDGITTSIYVAIHYCPECDTVNNDASVDVG